MDNSDVFTLYSLVFTGDIEKLSPLHLSAVDLNKIDETGCTLLHLACANNHTEVIKLLIYSGADIQAKDNNLTTPLHWSSIRRNFEIVQLLIDKGADWQSEDRNGIQPIHLAALRCHTEIVQYFLLKLNDDPGDNSGITPLHLAAYAGCKETVKAILERDIFDVDVEDNMGITPLNLAAASSYPKIVKLLVDNGAVQDLCDEYYNFPIGWAAANGDLESINYLQTERFTSKISAENYTPLFLATLFAHEHVIVHFLKIGHSINLDDGDYETYSFLKNADGPDEWIIKNLDTLETLPNVLHWAVAFCSLNVVKKLLSNFELEELGRTHNTPLHTAAAFGNTAVVQYLIERGADVDAKDQSENTSLHWAIAHGHYDTVKLLLDKGADKTCALHWAAATGHLDSAKLLLESGCNKFEKDYAKNDYSRTPLQWAARCGQSEMFKFLLDNGADINNNELFHWLAVNGNVDMLQLMIDRGYAIDSRDLRYNRTALHSAVLAGQYEVCKFLLDHQVDVNAVQRNGDLPIHCAVTSNNVEIVKLLIEKGAKLDEHGDVGRPLSTAARENKFEVLKALVDGGADMNLPDYCDVESPLIGAVHRKYHKIVNYLLEKGADCTGLIHNIAAYDELVDLVNIINSGENINSIDSYGNTPLFYAVKRNMTNTKYLVEHGAKVNHKNTSGETALINAINYENVQTIEYLLEHGADINYQNSIKGETPLIHAIDRRLLNITMLLVGHGADIELSDGRYGERPIHHACGSQRLEILKFLLSNNASVNVLDNENKTPLHQAARKYCLESLLLLIDKGVNVNVVSKLGTTALSIAVANKHYENCKLMLLYGADPHLNTKIIHCCIGTGCLKTLKLLHLSGLHLSQVKDPRNEEGYAAATEEIKEYLEKIETLLLTLKELSRIACRKAFGRKYRTVIEQQHLSQTLKRYLLFDNLH